MSSRYEACIKEFNADILSLKSMFARVFNPYCIFLDECYGRCLNIPKKEECDNDFHDLLTQKCQDEYVFIMRNLC